VGLDGFLSLPRQPLSRHGRRDHPGIPVASILLGLVCGLAAALMRLSSLPYLRLPAAGYIWLMRGTPVLVQLIIIYTGLPQLRLRMNVIQAAIVGLGINEGAYLAEIFRAGSWRCRLGSPKPHGRSVCRRCRGCGWSSCRRHFASSSRRSATPSTG
jgi:His/Glu/Gln/Arg/opine family amino acid ABC transporter permease subunit